MHSSRCCGYLCCYQHSSSRHVYVLLWLAADIIVNCLLGFTPFVDNFTHLGGFLYGFCIGFASIDRLVEESAVAREQRYALDNEEAELGVGCSGVLLHDNTGQVSAGLSVSAPIERRDISWAQELLRASDSISRSLGSG